VAYIFSFSLLKCLDDAQFFLGYVLLTKPSFCIIFLSSASCAHPSQEGLWWTISCGLQSSKYSNQNVKCC